MDMIIKKVPEDVRKILLREQKEEKVNRGTNQYSFSSVIFKLIREWNNNCRKTEK